MHDTTHECAYLDILEAMRDMVLLKGPASRLLWANKSFREYYGMSESELREVLDGPQSDPDDTQQYVRDDQRVFDIADHLNVVSETVTDVNGVVRDFQTIKSPIFENDEVARVVCVSRLINDDESMTRRLSHIDAKALAKPLRLLTSAFPLAIALTDTLGRVVSTSPEWRSSFDEVEGEPAIDDLTSIPGLEDPLVRALSEGASSAVPVQLPSGDGLLALDVRLGPWRYDDGALGGAIVLAIDVTAEAERQSELEMMIDKRIQAEMSLRQINDDLEHFAHIAAHDLREPARRQLMLTDLLMEEHAAEISPKLLGELERVRDQSRKMLAMITGFRELSGLMGPSTELDDIELPNLVDEVVRQIIPANELDGVFVSVPGTIRGYSSLLSALFKNLLENAVLHGAKPLNLRIEHFVEGDVTTYSVSNSWSGDERLLDSSRLFKAFVRDHKTSEGTGLGMSICKRVVERHRGQIWLEPGERFDVRFTMGEHHETGW